MDSRTTESKVRFYGAFSLPGLDRMLPAGCYRIVTEESLLKDISFLAYRRTSTSIIVPIGEGSEEVMLIEPEDLNVAIAHDRVTYASATEP